MDLHDRLALNVRHYRRNKELTQRDLADIAGVSYQTIQNIEYARNSPRLVNLMAVAGALEIDVKELLGD